MPRETAGPIVKALLASINRMHPGNSGRMNAYLRGNKESHPQPIISTEDLEGYHPTYALYLYVRNQVDILSRLIAELPELAQLSRLVESAEADYNPCGPPESPVTSSFFFFWSVFDAAAGGDRETVGDCIYAVARRYRMGEEFLRVMESMLCSRMGLYVNEGSRDNLVQLRELVTGMTMNCIVPNNYSGLADQVWFARVLPPPLPEYDEYVVITKPYVIVGQPETAWAAYLERTLPVADGLPHQVSYAQLMKYGLELRYWNDYIVNSYVGFDSSAIFLKGLPDAPEGLAVAHQPS